MLIIQKDLTKSFQYYQRAAAKGDVYSQYSLAWALAQGKGVPQNWEKAYYWANIAAANADDDLRESILKVRTIAANNLTPSRLAKAQEESGAWKAQPEKELY